MSAARDPKPIDPAAAREFAVHVVEQLRAKGFQAYWAGGCVRDLLLGRQPKDYDVATDAHPEEVRRVFGFGRTLPLGAAFGIITVLGPPQAGQVEVATFRRDSPYSDGRHPDSVTFSSAKEDALRRDFTINGLFYDPLSGEVIDYVNGQADLQRRVIRAIGDPNQRFAEDWLRMLRAARFAAAYELTPDPDTAQAIRSHAEKISGISPERISAEVLRLLVDPHRTRGIELLREWNLLLPILPELNRVLETPRWRDTLNTLAALQDPDEATALAALVEHAVPPDTPRSFSCRLAKRWKLSNRIRDKMTWLLDSLRTIDRIPNVPWSQLQPLVAHDDFHHLLALARARWSAQGRDTAPLDDLEAKRSLPQHELDPPPLLTGDDLIKLGWKAGPSFRSVLSSVRAAQLDGQIASFDEAVELARQVASKSETGQQPEATEKDQSDGQEAEEETPEDA